MSRHFVPVVLGLAVAAGGLAGEADREQRDLMDQVRQLQRQLVEAISRGEEATTLRGTLRDIREARKSDDWPKVRELITAAKKDPGTTTTPTPGAATPTNPGDAAPILPERLAITSGQITLSGLLWKPVDTKRACPGVVMVADGFRGVGRTFREISELLAQKGYVVLAPELRGQGKSGGKVEFLGGEVDDVGAAVAFIKEQTYVDPERVMLVGGGWGGTAALLAAGKGTAVVKGTAALEAPTDLYRLGRDRPGFRISLREKGIDFNPRSRTASRSRSPLFNTRSFAGECLLVYAKAAGSMPEDQHVSYASVLGGRGITVTVKPHASMRGDFVQKRPEVYRGELLEFLDKLSGLRKKTKRRTTSGGSRSQRRRR